MALKRINLLPPEARAKASRERGLTNPIQELVASVALCGCRRRSKQETTDEQEGQA